VLVEYTKEKDLSESQAIAVATGIMFNSSNKLYNLGYPPQGSENAADPKVLSVMRYRDSKPAQGKFI
jgi:hypothetical protein